MEKGKKQFFRNKKLVLLALLVLFLAAAIAGLSYFNRISRYKQAVNNLSYAEVNLSTLADGTYVGECNVDVLYAKVQVTLTGGRITSIELLEHKNERGASAEPIVGRIIQEQRVDVDAISGATNSSKVIKKAVENALRS